MEVVYHAQRTILRGMIPGRDMTMGHKVSKHHFNVDRIISTPINEAVIIATICATGSIERRSGKNIKGAGCPKKSGLRSSHFDAS